MPAANLAELFFGRARELGGRPRYRVRHATGWREVSWAEMERRVLAIAAGLLELGVEPGDRVALLSGTRAEWMEIDFAILACGATLFLFVRQGYDTSTGLVSGYMVTLLMLALYIPQFLRERDRTPYSPFVAWCKLLGNGLVIGFCVLVYPDNHFLQAICGITLVLDVYYVFLFHTRSKVAAA